MLEVRNIETGYGRKQVLFDVSLDVAPAEIVAVIGPNGAGKSTLLKAVSGLLSTWSGSIRFGQLSILGARPAQIVAQGITFCRQGGRVFDEMSVRENLEIGGYRLPKPVLRDRIRCVLDFFPPLQERLRESAARLSGGEQQMLALARALVPEPKLLLLDEPSLGLSPALVDRTFEKIAEINRETGVAVLIVEQKVRQVLSVAGRAYGLKLGRAILQGRAEELRDARTLKELFL